jgi:hypothetical protein
MQYASLTGLLEKFSNLVNANTDIKLAIQNEIKNLAQVDVPLTALRIKDHSLHITVSGNVKNEIYMNQDMIIANIKTLYGTKAPIKIVF